MNINCNLAVNSLSFGYCSYHLLHEFWRRGIEISWFPIGGNADFSSFNKAEPEFLQWCQNAGNNAPKTYNKNNPTLKLWHINQSWEQIGTKQYLFTFFELDSLEPNEVNILNQQEAIFVSSEETKQVFEQYGVTRPVHYIPLGFDSTHFYKTGRKSYQDEVTSWTLHAKFEKRKHTAKVIQTWLKKFANNRNHVLNLAVTNPFIKPEDNAAILNQVFGGQKFFNVNPLPYMKTLGEVNDLYNATDICLDLSGAEGYSLPAFNMLALGKHGIIHNCSAMRGWANSENAVLIEPNGKEPVFDQMFFHKGAGYNQGNIYTFDENDLLAAFDKVLERKKANKVNEAGLKLQERFKWEFTVDKIIKIMKI